ncbi:hypothetical protein M378DRAFT_65739 [Amanita muscaria Koide BX008]|uniref:Tubulin-specific chaperone A n=1 Tax=Amanita muscaria (strain Koide BX008) TaxID=946122 RepID=A0A0C2TW14_AMAMK|nr:hypothetical protein M378DRAFT_65739 [Amanita muscaria Koide BX008]
MDPPAIRRQLKIKGGVVKRLYKEHGLYKTETTEQQAKRDKLKEEKSAEEWDVKNAEKMLEESKKMVEDSRKRLGNALQELRSLVKLAQDKPELKRDDELINAEQVLKEVEQGD